MGLELVRVPCAAPDDVRGWDEVPSELRDRVRAVLGKTEGNGCVNDFARALAARAWRDVIDPGVVTVMSGGTEGVLSPHATFFAAAPEEGAPTGGLGVGVSMTGVIGPQDIGRLAQVMAVRDGVLAATAQGGFEARHAAMVVAKCPLLTSDQIDEVQRLGESVATTDTYESMAFSRAATALGIGLACGEFDEAAVERALAGDRSVYSAVASTSAGVELVVCEIVAIGPSPTSTSSLHASTAILADACDADTVVAMLRVIRDAGGEAVQVFAKCEPDPSGRIRGQRHTMLTDSDINATRHARAAVGGLLAGLVGRTDLYVSGGAEHQGPPGGGTITIVWRR